MITVKTSNNIAASPGEQWFYKLWQ